MAEQTKKKSSIPEMHTARDKWIANGAKRRLVRYMGYIFIKDNADYELVTKDILEAYQLPDQLDDKCVAMAIKRLKSGHYVKTFDLLRIARYKGLHVAARTAEKMYFRNIDVCKHAIRIKQFRRFRFLHSQFAGIFKFVNEIITDIDSMRKYEWADRDIPRRIRIQHREVKI